MSVIAVVGANWGDEGKGKMIDYLASHSSYVVRYQGGSNAGHTIINEHGKFALHMLPSGVCHPNVINVIGNGVAFDIESFFKEYDELKQRDINLNIRISNRAQIVLPIHRLFDYLEETRLGDRQYGSTKKGIAPFYADKYAKLGIQLCELFDESRLRKRIFQMFESKNVLLSHLYYTDEQNVDECVYWLLGQGEKLKPFIFDTSKLLTDAYRNNETILLEGQLGALRDPDHGIYPFSTSSSTLAGFATVGAGIPAYSITNIIAVTKAYSSCVGTGPFVSEIYGHEAEELRTRGGDAGEFGTTTGRARRVGWFDVVATKYGCRVQGATQIAITNLDVLSYLETIPVCVAYKLVNGTIVDDFPSIVDLEDATPIVENFKGWKCDITHIKSYNALPIEAKHYIQFIEKSIGINIRYISNGPKREQLIVLEN